jgi:hypothetical protein
LLACREVGPPGKPETPASFLLLRRKGSLSVEISLCMHYAALDDSSLLPFYQRERLILACIGKGSISAGSSLLMPLIEKK